MPWDVLKGVVFVCGQAKNPECFLMDLMGHEYNSNRGPNPRPTLGSRGDEEGIKAGKYKLGGVGGVSCG
jgi:hypothetical protein